MKKKIAPIRLILLITIMVIITSMNEFFHQLFPFYIATFAIFFVNYILYYGIIISLILSIIIYFYLNSKTITLRKVDFAARLIKNKESIFLFYVMNTNIFLLALSCKSSKFYILLILYIIFIFIKTEIKLKSVEIIEKYTY